MSSVTPVVVSTGEPTDVVYVFRRVHDKDFDLEMLYSLRSVKKHLKGYRRIYVIGEAPRFPEDVCVDFERIPMEDKFKTSQHNVRAKLQRAVKLENAAPNFVLMNDDFFFLQEYPAAGIPYYRQGTLPQHIEWREEQAESPYVRALLATKQALESKGLPVTDFECHAPILLDRLSLEVVVGDELFDWAATYGLLFRSLYCNWLGLKGERRMDLKIDSPMDDKQLDRCFQTCGLLSTGPGGLNEPMMAHLRAYFPPG